MRSDLSVVTEMYLNFLLVNVTQFVAYYSYDRLQTFNKVRSGAPIHLLCTWINFADIGTNTSLRYTYYINKTFTFNINIYALKS